MRARQEAETHQELADDEPACETEGLPEKPRPLGRRARMMRLEPGIKRAVRLAQLLDTTGVGDDSLDLEPVADNACIVQQAVRIGLAKSGDPIDIELGESSAKGGAFLQDSEPGQPGLIAFQDQAIEQHRFLPWRETVFSAVIRPVQRMPGSRRAIGGAPLTSREN